MIHHLFSHHFDAIFIDNDVFFPFFVTCRWTDAFHISCSQLLRFNCLSKWKITALTITDDRNANRTIRFHSMHGKIHLALSVVCNLSTVNMCNYLQGFNAPFCLHQMKHRVWNDSGDCDIRYSLRRNKKPVLLSCLNDKRTGKMAKVLLKRLKRIKKKIK